MNRYIALEEEADWDEFAVDLGWMFEGAEGFSSKDHGDQAPVMIDRSEDPEESEPDAILNHVRKSDAPDETPGSRGSPCHDG